MMRFPQKHLRAIAFIRFRVGRIPIIIIAVIAIIVFILTAQYNPIRGNCVIHNNLGAGLIQDGRCVEGKLHLEEALRICPEYKDAMHNLGVVNAIFATQSVDQENDNES